MSRTLILVTGAQGQLGQSLQWIHKLAPQDSDLVLLGRDELDITQTDSISHALDKYKPAVLINAAAYTAVDKAESEPDLAHLINGVAPGLLAIACAQRAIKMVHVSTDYVFDGLASQPYPEEAPTAPVSVYGQSKLKGEQSVLNALPSAIVLRTSWVFSQFGNNFLKTMLRLGRERAELSIVADQIGGPSYAPHIGQVLLSLAAQQIQPTHRQSPHSAPSGIYHFAGQPYTSWYDFAHEIFKQATTLGLLAQSPALHPIPSSQYPTPATRPAQSSLEQGKLNALLGDKNIERDWSKGIEQSLLFLQKQAE